MTDFAEQHDHDVLDLTGLAPQRRKVRLTDDGPLVEMASPNDLTIRHRAELSAAENRKEALNEKTRPKRLPNAELKRLGELEEAKAGRELTSTEEALRHELERKQLPGELTEDEEAELEGLTDRTAEIVLFTLTPDEVAALPRFQKEGVVLDFTMRYGTTIAKLAKAAGGPELAQAMEALAPPTSDEEGALAS